MVGAQDPPAQGYSATCAPRVLDSQPAGRGRDGQDHRVSSALGNRRASGAWGCGGAEGVQMLAVTAAQMVWDSCCKRATGGGGDANEENTALDLEEALTQSGHNESMKFLLEELGLEGCLGVCRGKGSWGEGTACARRGAVTAGRLGAGREWLEGPT